MTDQKTTTFPPYTSNFKSYIQNQVCVCVCARARNLRMCDIVATDNKINYNYFYITTPGK